LRIVIFGGLGLRLAATAVFVSRQIADGIFSMKAGSKISSNLPSMSRPTRFPR
jgi:hypothetical protein